MVGTGPIHAPSVWHTWVVAAYSEVQAHTADMACCLQFDAQIRGLHASALAWGPHQIAVEAFITGDAKLQSVVVGGCTEHGSTGEWARPCWLCSAPDLGAAPLEPSPHLVNRYWRQG